MYSRKNRTDQTGAQPRRKVGQLAALQRGELGWVTMGATGGVGVGLAGLPSRISAPIIANNGARRLFSGRRAVINIGGAK